jgi:MoxR-like ATPase
MPFERKLPVNFVDELRDEFGNNIDASHVKKFATKYSVGYATVSRKLKNFQVKKGTWNLTIQEGREILTKALSAPSVIPSVEQNLVPEVVDTFVPFGNFNDVKKIIQSGIFYPAFITGLSGNGKTFSVEQACAKANRELIRVNISIETDEDDLIGGFRLVDGNTVWHNGPVVEALERGAVLLLDEIDLASNKILCLQSILEGKGVFLKKIGKYVKPAKGFTVVATANTKGKGSEDGRFVGTNVLNEAFLERFPVTFEQNYPHPATELKILEALCTDKEFCKRLTDWADIIRKTFFDGGIDEVISTRRLVHIVRAYEIFGNRAKAITACISRFDEETKEAFQQLYDKVDADVSFEV